MKIKKLNILSLILIFLCLLASCNIKNNDDTSSSSTETTEISYSYSDIERLEYQTLWGYT